VAALRTALIETVTEEDMRAIAQQLVVMARLGDMAAIKLLFQYVVGKPAAAVDPDTLDHEELELYRRGPTAAQVQELACERLPADAVAEVLRVEMPCLGASFMDRAARGVLGIGPEDERVVDEKGAVEEQRQQQAAPSANGGVTDDQRRTMTAPSANGDGNRRADAAPLMEKLAAALLGAMGAAPSTNRPSFRDEPRPSRRGDDDNGGRLRDARRPEPPPARRM
jgi:hypothetical protein